MASILAVVGVLARWGVELPALSRFSHATWSGEFSSHGYGERFPRESFGAGASVMEFAWNNPAVAEQVPINQAIVESLIDFIPDSWRRVELRLKFGVGDGGVSQQVVNPATGEGWTVSHDLVMAVLQLDRHRWKFELGWRSAVYSVQQSTSGEWEASASFN